MFTLKLGLQIFAGAAIISASSTGTYFLINHFTGNSLPTHQLLLAYHEKGVTKDNMPTVPIKQSETDPQTGLSMLATNKSDPSIQNFQCEWTDRGELKTDNTCQAYLIKESTETTAYTLSSVVRKNSNHTQLGGIEIIEAKEKGGLLPLGSINAQKNKLQTSDGDHKLFLLKISISYDFSEHSINADKSSSPRISLRALKDGQPSDETNNYYIGAKSTEIAPTTNKLGLLPITKITSSEISGYTSFALVLHKEVEDVKDNKATDNHGLDGSASGKQAECTLPGSKFTKWTEANTAEEVVKANASTEKPANSIWKHCQVVRFKTSAGATNTTALIHKDDGKALIKYDHIKGYQGNAENASTGSGNSTSGEGFGTIAVKSNNKVSEELKYSTSAGDIGKTDNAGNWFLIRYSDVAGQILPSVDKTNNVKPSLQSFSQKIRTIKLDDTNLETGTEESQISSSKGSKLVAQNGFLAKNPNLIFIRKKDDSKNYGTYYFHSWVQALDGAGSDNKNLGYLNGTAASNIFLVLDGVGATAK